jgi:hypothetical protein
MSGVHGGCGQRRATVIPREKGFSENGGRRGHGQKKAKRRSPSDQRDLAFDLTVTLVVDFLATGLATAFFVGGEGFAVGLGATFTVVFTLTTTGFFAAGTGFVTGVALECVEEVVAGAEATGCDSGLAAGSTAGTSATGSIPWRSECSTTRSISSSGAGLPVQISNWRAPCWTNISTPVMTAMFF